MKRIVFHYLGSSYARHIHSHLVKALPQYQWEELQDGQLPSSRSTLLLSPTPGQMALNLLTSIPELTKAFLLLDLNHQFFDDATALLDSRRIAGIFSPFPVPNKRTQYVHSISVQMAKAHVRGPALNRSDYFYVSQPLLEDNRPGPDQFQLLRELLNRARHSGCLVYCKRHPRETTTIPPDILAHACFRLWERTIEDAYNEFDHWYGLNSLPLICAGELGRQANFYEESRWLSYKPLTKNRSRLLPN